MNRSLIDIHLDSLSNSVPSPGMCGIASDMHVSKGEVLSFFVLSSLPYYTNNQSWTWEWSGNEANEVMQQLNQSAPDAQSVHIVTMEAAYSHV